MGTLLAVALVLGFPEPGGAYAQSGVHSGNPVAAAGSLTYPSVILADHPLIYYRIGDSVCCTATDSSGNGAAGQYSSSTVFGVGGAILGDSDTAVSNSTITQSGASLPSGNAPRTLEAWFKAATGYASTLFRYGDYSNHQFGVVIDGTSPALCCSVLADGSYVTLGPERSVGDGVWHLIDVTYDGATAAAYVDGQLVGSAAIAVNTTVPGNGLTISGIPGGDGAVHSLDEAAIYPSALNATAIGNHLHPPLSGTGSPTITPQLPETVTEGQSVPMRVATFTDPDGNTTPSAYTATIHWGDGNTSAGIVAALPAPSGEFLVVGQHAYKDETSGPFQTTLTIVDSDGTSTTSPVQQVTVSDGPLTLYGSSVTTTAHSSTPLTLAALDDANPESAVALLPDYWVRICWGDGACTPGQAQVSFTFGFLGPPGRFTVEGSHQYSLEGTYQATITVSDEGGQSATAATTVWVQPRLGPSITAQSSGPPWPSDSTGAMGPNSYIQMTNAGMRIYGRNGQQMASASLTELNVPPPTGFNPSLAPNVSFESRDVQIIYDSVTNRFYYLFANRVQTSGLGGINQATNYFITLGVSKTSNPMTATDFCPVGWGVTLDTETPLPWHALLKRGFPSNTFLPDFPKLGDTADSLLIGYMEAPVIPSDQTQWNYKHGALDVVKKADLQKCSSHGAAVAHNALADNLRWPTPTHQLDGQTTGSIGWVIAMPCLVSQVGAANCSNPSASATTISLLQWSNGNLMPAGVTTVPPYSVPVNAPTKVANGSPAQLDTIGAQFTDAVFAIDPQFGDRPVIWTQDTVLGGAGSEVRWYEIDPSALMVLQSGKISSPTQYYFNASISSDRHQGIGGSDVVLTFNDSQEPTTGVVTIDVVVKRGVAGPQSGPVPIATSSTLLDTASSAACDTAPVKPSTTSTVWCRWGDYAGAIADPLPGSAGGAVWITGMLTNGGSWDTRITQVLP